MIPFLKAKDAYLTCAGRDDGGGAQISAQISTMILARRLGLGYAHTPLSNVAHAPDGVSADEWAADWENFFNLGAGEFPAAEAIEQGLHVRQIRKAHRFVPKSKTLHVVYHCHKVTDTLPQCWADIAPTLREKYALSPKPDIEAHPGSIRIAVHLRRGDVTASGRFSERYTADQEVLESIERLIKTLGSERCRVELFSQGNPGDFDAYRDIGCDLQLDGDVFTSFHRMASADILFTAVSTFSYLAGVIGTGVVVYEDFWHPRLPDWIDRSQLADPDVLRRLKERFTP